MEVLERARAEPVGVIRKNCHVKGTGNGWAMEEGDRQSWRKRVQHRVTAQRLEDLE